MPPSYRRLEGALSISCPSDVAERSGPPLCPCYFHQAASFCRVQCVNCLPASARRTSRAARVVQEVELLVRVIYKTSHVQGSRNKLVHVCNKGGGWVTEGKGERLISVRAPNTKMGAYSPVMFRRCVPQTCASQMFQNSQVVSHTHTHFV